MWQFADDGFLRPHRRLNGNWEVLDSIDVGTQAGVRYHIKIQLEGNQISTWIDDILVDQRTDDFLSRGRVGFRQDTTEIALFDNINVCIPNFNTCTSSNIALGKTVNQSSTAPGGDAALAVDGKFDGAYASQFVSQTEEEDNPWWEIDLGTIHNISHIRLNNRTDELKDYLQKYRVFISNEPFESYDLDATMQQSGVKKMYRKRSAKSQSFFDGESHRPLYTSTTDGARNTLALRGADLRMPGRARWPISFLL